MKYLLPLICSLLLFTSCNNDDEEQPKDPLVGLESSYEIIQATMWDQSCTSCHVAGSSFARQSDLILTADVSYEQLINRPPNNEAAKADGLELVGDKGLESLYTSFLWEKINVYDQEHFYSDHPGYGTQMPLGDDPLTNGQLEFIRQWILAGAPKAGDVIDREILKDTARLTEVPFEPLPVPENGYQFHVEPFEIKANSDREIFIYQKLNNPEPIYMTGFEIAMSPGSHHFILHRFPTTFTPSLLPNEGLVRDVYNSSGEYQLTTLYHMQFHEFVAGTQVPKVRYNYPEGVGIEIPVNSGFDMNSHYANRKNEAIMGEVFANVYTSEASEIEHVAQILNLNNDNFVLPANQVTTLEKAYTFAQDRYVFQLWSHAHEHNKDFKVFIHGGERDGELVYFSNDWEHPPILQIDPPLHLKAGEGLKLEATYDNWENRNLTFGLRSTDEMMILFGAYYE